MSRSWPAFLMASSPTWQCQAAARCLFSHLGSDSYLLPALPASHSLPLQPILRIINFPHFSSMPLASSLNGSTVLCTKSQILKMVFKASHNLSLDHPQRPCLPPRLLAPPTFGLTHTELLTAAQVGCLCLPLCCSPWKKTSHWQELHGCEGLPFILEWQRVRRLGRESTWGRWAECLWA